MEKYNVVILTGGLGTRLHKYTANLYPKILISLGNETMLDRMIKYYDNMSLESLRIVVSTEENRIIIETYLKTYHHRFLFKNKVQVVLYPKLDGSFTTIFKTIRNKGLKNVILHWSDILPLEENVFSDCYMDYDVSVATDNNPRHRINIGSYGNKYTVEHYGDRTGNIPGYFFVQDFDKTFTPEVFEKIVIKHKLFKNGQELDFTDALDYLTKNNTSISRTSSGFIDIGDSEKYEKFMENVPLETRSFNYLEFNDDVVIKTAINEKGNSLLYNEYQWYKFANTYDVESIKMLDESSTTKIILERFKGVTVDQFLQVNTRHTDIKNILELFNTTISKLHNTNGDINLYNSLVQKEYLLVTEHRLDEIGFILGREVASICITTKTKDKVYRFKNPSSDYMGLVTEAYKHIEKLYNTDYGKGKYGYIHGDTNTSNVMVNHEGTEMVLIDPRGNFGGYLGISGDIHYDWAKFIYGLQGYARFSTDKSFRLVFDEDLDRLFLNITPYQVMDIDDVLKIVKEIKPELDTKVLRLLVGIIHIKLGQYIKNNLSKTIATVQYGRYLLETTLYKD